MLGIRYGRLNRRGSLSAAESSPNAAQHKLYRRRRVYTDDPHISPPQYIMPASSFALQYLYYQLLIINIKYKYILTTKYQYNTAILPRYQFTAPLL